MSGTLLQFTGSVCQLRSDWVGLKQIFSFGGWNASRMCWMCEATQPNGPVPYDDVTRGALWRKLRTTPKEFIKSMMDRNVALSPVLLFPGFQLPYIAIDILHCMDLGGVG